MQQFHSNGSSCKNSRGCWMRELLLLLLLMLPM